MSRRLQRGPRLCVESLEPRTMLSIGISGMLQPLAFRVGSSVSDDYGNNFTQAAQVSLTSAGSASQSGSIERAGDVDMLRFVAPVTGQMIIREVASSGNRLDPLLSVYNANQQLVARNDDDGTSLNSRVVINVTAGATYFVKAAGYGRSTGAYQATFATTPVAKDDYGNTLTQATLVVLSTSGAGTQSGRVEQAGDVDMFSIVATVSGQMAVSQSAASGSRLDSYLYVYDAAGQLLARSDDDGSTVNSRVEISVVAGTTYFVKAAAYQRSTGAYTLDFQTVADVTAPTTPITPITPISPITPATPVSSEFQIDVTLTGFSGAQQQIIQQAVDRWEQIIVGDLPDVNYLGRVIDDLAISITSIRIDGNGGILGQSSATAFRSGSELPYLGFIQLDTADVARMQSNGSLLGVVEHEIAHVLGFGVIWSDLGLVVGASTSAPGFSGVNAVAEYNAIFGTNVMAVPVEAGGGAGTSLAHWNESVLANELMTGWYNAGQTNPISRITVASLADLGYQVNMSAADPYSLRNAFVAAPTATSNAYNSVRSSNDISWHGRDSERRNAIDLIMESFCELSL
jgi:hypothetical protein